MRITTPELRARLHADATRFCRCWALTRRDGVRLGFTDHDRDLAFDGTTFAAHAGLDGANVESTLGFAVGGTEVSGALTAGSMREDDLASGLYDGATLEIWLADWSEVAHRLLLDVATMGEVKRSEFAFTAELRGLAHRLDQETGRSFRLACSADLGDERCGVSLAAAPFRMRTNILAGASESMFRILRGDAPAGWFTDGRAIFESGAQASIRSHQIDGDVAILELWSPLGAPLAGGSVTLTAGCDKSFATCRGKFANALNFRGFPHMPGNDVLMSHAGLGGVMDGGSLFK
ncbi:MAG: hypothetical protein JWL93_2737 [Hyphomicrobiales bacterium]|jgi:uncharacterized phage protein (TIGR02218 family)|nr:hypothetical protein [Hyphomicrobiales bacterium]